MSAISTPAALAAEPAPPPESSPVPAPDPDPDPAPPAAAPKVKPPVKAPPAKAATVTRRAPVATTPAVAPPPPTTASAEPVPVRRVRHRPLPARTAKRPLPVQRSQPTRPRPRRELPFASFVPAPAVAKGAPAPSHDPDRIDLTWPAIVVLGAALAAVAAAAGSAAAPSFRLALAGSLAGASTRLPNQRAPRTGGHFERRVRRPRREPTLAELPAPEQPAAPPEPGTHEIEWFRGYVKSRFFVLLEEPDGYERLVESPWFAWRQTDPPPPSPEFVAARDALLAKLECEGWHECGRGQAWYSRRVTARSGA
jgi:hypothetical protein